MLRFTRLIMMVLVSMFAVAVPTAVAQDPVTDQYETPVDESGAAPADDEGALPADEGALPADEAGAAPAEDAGAAPVQVRSVQASNNQLPFTGGQISLIALIGLGLLALGAAGVATTRKRPAATSP